MDIKSAILCLLFEIVAIVLLYIFTRLNWRNSVLPIPKSSDDRSGLDWLFFHSVLIVKII